MGSKSPDSNAAVSVEKADEKQFVTFALAEERYGIPVNHVVEVIRMVAMAEPPEAADYIVGLINVRGRVVPVIDMRARLGLETASYNLTTPILIVRAKNITVGLVVDKVSEVAVFSEASIEPPVGDGMATSKFVAGVAKTGHKLLFILNLGGLVTNDTAKAINKFIADAQSDSGKGVLGVAR